MSTVSDRSDVPAAVEVPTAPRATRPGWDIAADLTPPEVLGARQLTVLRRGLGAALATALVLCVAGWLLAVRQHAGAEDALAAEQARTASLRAESQRYAVVTTLEGTSRSIDAQITTLLAGDVDVVTLLQRIHRSLPSSMTVTTETVSLEQAGAAEPTSVGSVTLAGGSRQIEDLATFVDRLEDLPGVGEVVPTSNTRTGSALQYAVTLALTDDALSHRFDQEDPS